MNIFIKSAIAGAAISMCGTPPAFGASGLTTLYTFTNQADGAYPIGGLIAGPHGVLYGAAALGGVGGTCGGGCGTIFQLTPPVAPATAWSFQVIYTFLGYGDGQQPINLTLGASGQIYGVAEYGGVSQCLVDNIQLGCGEVFELAPPPQGQTSWTFTTLHTFSGQADGAWPAYGVALTSTGNLVGFALGGGLCTGGNCGTVFELSPTNLQGAPWEIQVLHNFNGGPDGRAPYGTPLIDAAGNIYGTTSAGGFTASATCKPEGGCGTVFEVSPPGAGQTAWTKKLLWAFSGADGIYPIGPLTMDAAGHLFGTVNLGGHLTLCPASGATPAGCGAVFQLSPPAAGSKSWTNTTLWSFAAGTDGLDPTGGVLDRNGTLYLTTSGNGVQGFGSVVQLAPPAGGQGAWKLASLHDFANAADGAQPTGPLLLRGGVMYGTTLGEDGPAPARYGTIFSIAP